MEVISRKDAKAAGLKRYFTGKPCKRGHIAERLVSGGTCMDCNAESAAKYRENNREALAERAAKYYEDNKEAALEYAAKYRENNIEACLKRNAKYYENNREAALEYAAKYRENNREACLKRNAKYYENNREDILEREAKRYAAKSAELFNQLIMLATTANATDWIESARECSIDDVAPEMLYQLTIIHTLINKGITVDWEVCNEDKSDRYDIVLPDTKTIVEVKATTNWNQSEVDEQLSRYAANNPEWTIIGTHPDGEYGLLTFEDLMERIA